MNQCVFFLIGHYMTFNYLTNFIQSVLLSIACYFSIFKYKYFKQLNNLYKTIPSLRFPSPDFDQGFAGNQTWPQVSNLSMDLRGADNLSSTAPLGDKTPVSTDRPDAGGVPIKVSTCVMKYDLVRILEDNPGLENMA